MPLQETGVKAEIRDHDEFMSGLKMMNLGIQRLGKAIAATARQSGRAVPQTEKAAQASQELGKVMQGATSGLTAAAGGIGTLVSALGGPAGLVVAIGVAVVAITSIVSGVKSMGEAISEVVSQAVNSFAQFAQQGLMLASRFREMENAAIAVGRSFGITDDATRDAISTLEDAGIRYDIAANSTLRMTRNQIDLANATDLARIAQATGIIVGEDSSATMDRLIHAISTGNTAMLGFMNITVTNNDVQREAQELFGKNVKALTAQEKTQARVNAIIKGSASVMGVYDAAMDSAGKSLRSLTGRLIPTLGAEMMKTFEPAFKTGVDAVSGLVKKLIEATKEGGALYPVLVNLGAAASLVADGFSAALKWISEWISNLNLTLSEGATTTVELMARWGVEMIAVFAEAIVNTAASALTQAMQFVASILTFWMAPGSPPRIAPHIDKWGAETLTEWFKGMTKADYSILGTIQSSLASFLDAEAMQQVSAQLAGYLGEGRALGAEFFETLTKEAGAFGKEVSLLVKQQLVLANATNALEAAERKLEESRRAISDAQTMATALTKEYNQLLKEGAPPDVLQAKLDEINAAEDQVQLAQQQAKEAGEEKAQAEAVLVPLREQAELQELLVRQLAKMHEQQAAMAASTKGLAKELGKAGDLDAGDIVPPDVEGMGDEISNKIGEAVEAAKAMLQEKLATIFEPLTTAWETSISPTLTQLGEDFNSFVTTVQTAWDTFTSSDTYKKIVEFFSTYPQEWRDLFSGDITMPSLAQDVFSTTVTWFQDNWPLIKDTVQTVSDAIATTTQWLGNVLVSMWEVIGPSIVGMAEAMWSQISNVVMINVDVLLGVIEMGMQIITGDWEGAWETFGELLQTYWDYIVSTIENNLAFVLAIFQTDLNSVRKQWDRIWTSVKRKAVEIWNKITDSWSQLWENIRVAINTKAAEIKENINAWLEELFASMGLDLDEMKERWRTIWEDVRKIVAEVWRRIVETISERVEKVRTTIKETIADIVEWWTMTWTTVSEKAVEIWNTITTFISEQIEIIHSEIERVLTEIKTWWDVQWQLFADKVNEIWQAIKDALNLDELYQKVAEGLENFVADVGEWINTNIGRVMEIGASIINGIKEGMLGGAGDLIEAFTSIMEDGVDAAKEKLGIQSPSKVFETLGSMAMAGFQQGVEQGISIFEQFELRILEIFTRIAEGIRMWVKKIGAWFTNEVPQYIEQLVTVMDETFIPTWERLRDVIGADDNSVLSQLMALDSFMFTTFLQKTIKKFVKWMFKEGGLIEGLTRVESLMWLIGEAVGTLVVFIKNAAEEFANFINRVDDARNAASPFVGESPSPLEEGITGATHAMRGMIPSVNRMTGAFSRVGMASPLPVSSTGTAVSTSTKTTNLNIGSVIINNGGMSWSDFRTRVTRAIVTSGA